MSYIHAHNLQAHDQLPPERELEELWGISRSTIRSAIASLTKHGILYSLQGSGTKVAPQLTRSLQDLESINEYAKKLNLNLKTEIIDFGLTTVTPPMLSVFNLQSDALFYRVERLRILNQIPTLLEISYLPQELVPTLNEEKIRGRSLFSCLKMNYGLTADHGEEKISITMAMPHEAKILGVAQGSPVFRMISETYTERDVLFEYCQTIARTDCLNLSSVLYIMDKQ